MLEKEMVGEGESPWIGLLVNIVLVWDFRRGMGIKYSRYLKGVRENHKSCNETEKNKQWV
jgi:hypothetical protein